MNSKQHSRVRRVRVIVLIVSTLLLAACNSAIVPPPTFTPVGEVATPVPTVVLTSTAMVVGDPTALPTNTPEPTTTPLPAPTATAIPPTATPVGEPILPRKIITAPVVSEKSFTGFAAVMESVSTLTDGVTVTNQIAIPAYLVPVPPAAPLIELPPNTTNIALLGIDTRPGEGGPYNTDVIIIASINPDIPAITMLSIPRDTLVYIPNYRSAKVNTAFKAGGKDGGPDLFRQTILYNFGINIDYFAMVNFSAVVNGVNTLDGIDVVATCPLFHIFPKDPYYFADESNPYIVTKPYTDSFSGEAWEVGKPVPTTTINIPSPGVYALNGLQALAFARARYGVPGGDIDRGRREQLVIRAMLSKARQVGSLTKLPELYTQFQQNIKTDLVLGDMLKLASFGANLDDVIIRSRYIDGGGLSGMTLPVVGSVLIPNRETMGPFIQQQLTVALNQRATDGIAIELVNGQGKEDFAAAAAYRLRELGFSVVKIEQSAEPISKTQVIDFSTSKKNSALPLLQRTFGLKSNQIITQPVAGAAPDAPRYRILVGKDFETCYYKIPGVQAAPKPTAAPTLVSTPPAEQPAQPPAPAAQQPAPQPQPQPTAVPAQPTAAPPPPEPTLTPIP